MVLDALPSLTNYNLINHLPDILIILSSTFNDTDLYKFYQLSLINLHQSNLSHMDIMLYSQIHKYSCFFI